MSKENNNASSLNAHVKLAETAEPALPVSSTISMISFMTSEQVSDAIKSVGCAVTAIDQDGVVRLHSASHGVGFQVLWGNAIASGQYADLTLSCPLHVQGGTLPAEVLSEWHRAKRFARVAQHGDFVVLEMDVIAAGGISPANLVVQLQLWTQMMGQFFLHLRNFKPATATAAVDTADSQAQPVTATA